MSSDGTEMKARITSIGEEINLNVRDDASSDRIRPRSEDELSDADEYDYLDEDDDDDEEAEENSAEEEEDEVTDTEEEVFLGDLLLDTPISSLIKTCTDTNALLEYAKELVATLSVGSENQSKVVNA
tara:strand:+ start:85 stop:465 length:381 start_codon:yes stop_codon:yes gene_type:complete